MRLRHLPKPSIFVLLMVVLTGAAGPPDLPRPPCGGPPMPAYPAAVGSPNVQSRSAAGWTPPSCLGWEGPTPTLLVAVTGRVHEPNGADALLARFGAVSALRGARYWSVTDHAWQTLIQDAFAVTDAAGTNRRGDFRPEELRPGIPLYSVERDGRSSAVVTYRLRVIARTPDRVVASVVNASPVRMAMVTLFAPGELQTTYFLDRLGRDEWGYFGLWGITTGLLTGGHEASSVNRAVALYRHFVRIPTDQEPPAAP